MISPELHYTTLSALLTGVIWMPYLINRIVETGPWATLKTPDPNRVPNAGWAARCISAHRNAVENLVVFAPLAIMVHIAGLSTAMTALAVAAYFWSRVAHLALYILGIPFLRTVAFAVGFGCQMFLAYTLLTGV